MDVNTKHKVGAVQVQDIQNDVEATLSTIQTYLEQADSEGLSILCFPECYLQGYALNIKETKRRAISLESLKFQKILEVLKPHKTTVILGMIEEDGGKHFNTAVVIKGGKLLGKYRKVHLFERNFESGSDYPAFTVDGLTFGINICYDARFSEGAKTLTEKGAKVIFYPLNNRLSTEKAKKYRDKHLPNLVAKAEETGCWIVSSDVIVQDGGTIGYGCTAMVDPTGRVTDRVAELQSGLVITELA